MLSSLFPFRWYLLGGAAVILVGLTGHSLSRAYEAGRALELAKRDALDMAVKIRIAENQAKQVKISRSHALAEVQDAQEAEKAISARLKEIEASAATAEAENDRLLSQINFLNDELNDATKDATRTEAERAKLYADLAALKGKLNRCLLTARDIDLDKRLHKPGSR